MKFTKFIFLSFLLTLSTSLFSQNYITCQNVPSSKNWTIVWGGKPSSKYGAKFMDVQSGYSFEQDNVLFVDYEASIEFCQSIISKFCRDCKLVSVYGFSRGGVNAWNQIGKVDFVGLIDPLIPSNYSLDFDTSKVFMLYNLGVWDSENRKRLEKVSDKLGTNQSKRLYMPHLEIPKLFFDKYKRGRVNN